MLSFCLTHNFFLFDDTFYCQTQGAAMGACFSPSYANLFMGWWEDRIANNTEGFMQVLLWIRYIDDLFIIWKGSEESAIRFVNNLNQNNLNLHFTSHISSKTVVFLMWKL